MAWLLKYSQKGLLVGPTLGDAKVIYTFMFINPAPEEIPEDKFPHCLNDNGELEFYVQVDELDFLSNRVYFTYEPYPKVTLK